MLKNQELFMQGKNFTVVKEGGMYFLTTSDGWETEYDYLNELERDIYKGYAIDIHKGMIDLIK